MDRDDTGAPDGDDVRGLAERLLDRRRHPQWVSLSWVALRPLISSLNEVLCKGTPSLVPRLRHHWTTQVPPTGTTPATSRHLDRGDVRAFVVIGDTGEQDRSQYIVAPVLRQVVEGVPGEPAPAFAVICSDVIYPSGDVNEYVHGLYLPYGPPPPPGAPGVPTRLERLPLLAIPGNHDWHDGLSGFMQQFCGTGPLPTDLVGWPDEPPVPGTRPPAGAARWREGLVRLLWRRPVAARPQPLWRRLPREVPPVLADGSPADAPRDVAAQRALRGAPTGQPGSYFSVQVDGLLVVAIDTGVGLGDGDSAVDAEQARWLVAVSRQPGPKVLLTGNPLLVNRQWKVCWLGAPDAGAPEPGTAPLPYRTVNEIVADPACGYVAAIGGDIHNFQHYVQQVGPDGGRPVHYVVSGGGGAYMSATHPVEVVASRTAGTTERDVEEVVRRNRLTGGAAAGGVDPAGGGSTDPAGGDPAGGSAGARRAPTNDDRLVDGPVRMIPSPPESLAHFARIVLPKLWRLERALLALLAGLAVGHGLHLARPGRTGAALLAGAGLLAALLVVRAFVTRPLTLRLFRSRDPEHDPRTRAYRAAVTLTAGLAGVDLALAGAWIAGPAWNRHLVAWTALTAATAVVAAVLRYTGWWRDPVPRDADTAGRRRAVALAVWAGCLLAAAGLGLLLPAGPRRWVPVATVAAVGVVAALLARWLRPAAPTLGDRWGRFAPLGSYLLQAVAALVVLCGAVFDRAWWLPLATLLGVLAFGAVLATSFAAAAGVVRLQAGVQARAEAGAAGRWQSGWGRYGGLAPWLTGLTAALLLVAQLAVALRSGLTAPGARVLLAVLWAVPLAAVAAAVAALGARVAGATLAVLLVPVAVLVAGLGDAAVAAYRQTLATELALGALLAVLLLVDTLRRRLRGRRFTLSAIAVAVAPLGLTWLLDLRAGWPLRAAVVPVVGALLVLVTVVLGHLVFLGAQYLVLDRPAHADRPDLLTLDEAAQFLAWRATESGRPGLRPRALRRARTVFPTTDSPRGPIQDKVSEIFDSDVPPFWKNFLVLRTEPVPGDAARRRLRIDVHVVRGTGTVAAESAPVAPGIVVDLPAS